MAQPVIPSSQAPSLRRVPAARPPELSTFLTATSPPIVPFGPCGRLDFLSLVLGRDSNPPSREENAPNRGNVTVVRPFFHDRPHIARVATIPRLLLSK
jgi:hypothetical protein